MDRVTASPVPQPPLARSPSSCHDPGGPRRGLYGFSRRRTPSVPPLPRTEADRGKAPFPSTIAPGEPAGHPPPLPLSPRPLRAANARLPASAPARLPARTRPPRALARQRRPRAAAPPRARPRLLPQNAPRQAAFEKAARLVQDGGARSAA